MKNPYLNSEKNGVFSAFDESINNATQDIPFIPENFNTANFLKGVLIGAGVAYLLSNEKTQNALFKGIAKAGALLQTGVEELKERYEDAKAEVESELN